MSADYPGPIQARVPHARQRAEHERLFGKGVLVNRPMATEASVFPEAPLIEALTQLHSLVRGDSGLSGFLTAAAVLVATVTTDTVVCSIALPPEGGRAVLGTSSPRAAAFQRLERVHDAGPSYEALRSRAVVYVKNLALDSRWPEYRRTILREGVATVLAVPLEVEARLVGVLTLYGPNRRQLAMREVHDVLVLADATAIALEVRQHVETQAQLNEQLRRAIASRPLIDQALGIVMARQGCTASEAFDLLRLDSQTANQPMREIAAGLVVAATGRPPEPARPFVDRGLDHARLA